MKFIWGKGEEWGIGEEPEIKGGEWLIVDLLDEELKDELEFCFLWSRGGSKSVEKGNKIQEVQEGSNWVSQMSIYKVSVSKVNVYTRGL